MKEKNRASAASIHQRLLNKARSTGEPFEAMLTRFTLERLLYRLSISPFSGEFLLKGAMLFALWTDQPFRPTRDLDMLSFGTANPQRLADIFRELCEVPAPFDALVFNANTVSAHEIREGQSYDGVRILLSAQLGKARLGFVFYFSLRQTKSFISSMLELIGLDLDILDHTSFRGATRR